YFTANLENPLLHTWSLGVEEQFYIFFPFCLLLIWRRSRERIWLWIVLAAIGSLAISQWTLGAGHVLASFYLGPSRAFELLLGALAALVVFKQRIPRLTTPVETSLGWLALGVIVWCVAVFDQATPFPGWHAVIPAAGTAVVLAFSRAQAWPGRLLSSHLLVG